MNAANTFAVYSQLGILAGLKNLATSFNRLNGRWELWGHFQTAEGKRNGKVAEFDTADEAVEFKALAGF